MPQNGKMELRGKIRPYKKLILVTNPF